jgi:hypothetical protein
MIIWFEFRGLLANKIVKTENISYNQGRVFDRSMLQGGLKLWNFLRHLPSNERVVVFKKEILSEKKPFVYAFSCDLFGATAFRLRLVGSGRHADYQPR